MKYDCLLQSLNLLIRHAWVVWVENNSIVCKVLSKCLVPLSARSFLNVLYHNRAASSIPYMAFNTLTYRTFLQFSKTTDGPCNSGFMPMSMPASTPVIFITTLSSPGSFFGRYACINALGMLHVMTSLSSFALITPVIKILSNPAAGLAASSQDNHPLVGFLLYTILPFTLVSLFSVRNMSAICAFFLSEGFISFTFNSAKHILLCS
jgi:hypothetical protein